MTERILVVDDNLSNLRHISEALEDLYSIITAQSGMEALQVASSQMPDLILLDIDMPEMDGFETLERLQKNGRLRHIPVIFLTARHDVESEVRALESGAVDFLTKPFEKSILANRIDMHLRLAHYQKQLLLSVKDLEDNIVASFTELIECRDENTGEHARRTGEHVALLGRVLRERGFFREELHDRELAMMVRAAPLHDIGKIGVSDAVLLKPGRLDEVEFEAMKQHTVIGASILDAMHMRLPMQRYLYYARLIAESHHERYDGKGFPYGLAGDAIPLCARIVAVARAYEALVADRVYRKAMTHEEACAIIIDGKGTRFDPRIVDVFELHHELFRGSQA